MNNEVLINVCFNFNTFPINFLETICFKLYPARVKHANKLSDAKKLTSLASFLLACFCIKQQFHVSKLCFFKINNKPFLKNQNHAFFNISHTKTAIACATANCPVGIDLEQLKPLNLNLAKKICCKSEFDHFLKLSTTTQKTHYLLKIWTAKESFAKLNAKSIFQNLKTVNCEHLNNIFTINLDNYMLSVCTKTHKKPIISKIDFIEIINFFKII